MIVIINGQLYTESTALLKVMQHLGLPFSIMNAGYFIPRPIRDFLYRRVAFNRYQLVQPNTVFCLLPKINNIFWNMPLLNKSVSLYRPLQCIQYTLAVLWIYQGFIPKILFQAQDELRIWQLQGFQESLASIMMQASGVINYFWDAIFILSQPHFCIISIYLKWSD